MGKTVLNEWPLSGWRADDMNCREWAEAEWLGLVKSGPSASKSGYSESRHRAVTFADNGRGFRTGFRLPKPRPC